MSDVWYFTEDGKQVGPFSLTELQVKLRGLDLSKFHIWRDGFADWKRAADVDELRPQPPKPPVFVEQGVAPPTPEVTSVEKKGRTWGELATSIVSALVGLALARTLGMTFWLPAVLIFLTWVVLGKLHVDVALRPALAILIGHMVWQIIGFSILYSMVGLNEAILEAFADLACVIALSVWLLRRSSIVGVGVLAAYEVAGIATLLLSGDDTHVGNLAIGMHIFLRTCGTVAAGYAAWVLWRRKQTGALIGAPEGN